MCDSVVAVGDETASGTTLFGKNSDRKPGECQPFLQFSEAAHPPGARVRCTHIEIPQVAETYRTMGHSPWWVWGYEHGVNEHAVAIGNQTVFSNEPIEEKPGLIGMDLVRLSLERGRSARESLEVIAGLIESHGQGGAALAPGGAGYHNSFLLADPRESWILETSNRRWAARRARLDALSNHMSLGSDWEIGSRDLESFARHEQWWQSSARIDIAAAYRNRNVPPQISEGRLRRSRELLLGRSGRHDVASLQRVLRDHSNGSEPWQPGPTPEDERFFTLCAHSEPVHCTTASIVAPLPVDRAAPWPVWISFGAPCTGIFLPVYLDGVIPAELARGGPESELDSAWWVFERLREAASRDWPANTRILRDAWAEMAADMESDRADVEAAARRAAVTGNRDRAAEIVTGFMSRTCQETLALADELRARLD